MFELAEEVGFPGLFGGQAVLMAGAPQHEGCTHHLAYARPGRPSAIFGPCLDPLRCPGAGGGTNACPSWRPRSTGRAREMAGGARGGPPRVARETRFQR